MKTLSCGAIAAPNVVVTRGYVGIYNDIKCMIELFPVFGLEVVAVAEFQPTSLT
jgi:hypothetical protein